MPAVDVTVGRAVGAAVALPGAPDVGTNTITPVMGEAVGIPAALVGVTKPMVVKATLPAVDVTVGTPAEGAIGLPEVPGVGTKTMTPVIGGAVGMPAAFVGVTNPMVV